MKPLAAFFAFLLLAGCSQGLYTEKARITSISPYAGFKQQMDALLPDTLFPPSNAAIKVVSLSTGETLYDLNSELAFTPGSNQKLFTSALALAELGPAYMFSTRAYVDTSGPPRFIVRGSGDPILSTGDIAALAGAMHRAAPPESTWTLAGDVSFFDSRDRGPGWAWDDEPDPDAMFISPLSLNGNAIRVLVRPGASPGDSVRVETDPSTSYVSIENSATTNPLLSKNTLEVSRAWREHSNRITVAGEMSPAESLFTRTLSVADPQWYTLTVLRERLEASGVPCTGIVLDSVPPRAPEIARCEHRLDSALTYMNLVSDNLSAENILKTVAAEKTGPPGNADSGGMLMKRFLSGFGIDTAKIVIADGSGVSRYNLTSAGAITALLAGMHSRAELFPAWYATLPVAGMRGTLAGRMRGTPAEGNLRAKTGTLQGVSSFSGYVTTAEGEQLAFAVIMEHFPWSTPAYRRVQDRIGVFLAGLRRSSF